MYDLIRSCQYLMIKNGRLNPFHATGLYLYPLETENLQFPDVFRRYRTGPLTQNGLWRTVNKFQNYQENTCAGVSF